MRLGKIEGCPTNESMMRQPWDVTNPTTHVVVIVAAALRWKQVTNVTAVEKLGPGKNTRHSRNLLRNILAFLARNILRLLVQRIFGSIQNQANFDQGIRTILSPLDAGFVEVRR